MTYLTGPRLRYGIVALGAGLVPCINQITSMTQENIAHSGSDAS